MRKDLPFFGKRRTKAPRGHRAYAVGDIHGRLDLLDRLLAMIEEDIASRPKAKNVLVFLGDLIDRGPHSAQVVERLRLHRPDYARMVFLMGNHEEVLLRILDGETALIGDWLKFGGAECLKSYGTDPQTVREAPAARALEIIRSAIPGEHSEFIRGFADTLTFGSYLFVHAGLRPGVPLADQAQTDLRWIRQPFLEDERDHGFVVVHGHTIAREVDERAFRIGIDTGAYRTDVLTAVGIEGAERWFLQTSGAIAAGETKDRSGSADLAGSAVA